MRLNASPFFSICLEKTSIESAIQLQSENRGIIARSYLKLLEYILKILFKAWRITFKAIHLHNIWSWLCLIFFILHHFLKGMSFSFFLAHIPRKYQGILHYGELAPGVLNTQNNKSSPQEAHKDDNYVIK